MPSSVALKLYTARTCPYAQRVTIALAELGLLRSFDKLSENDKNLEVVEFDLQNKPEWYTKEVNPRGKLPALQIGSDKKNVLVESVFLAQYLIEEYGSKLDLILPSPIEHYNTSYLADLVSNVMFYNSMNVLRAQTPDEQSRAKEFLLSDIRDINTFLVKLSTNGPFAFGDKFTFGDLLSGPFVLRSGPMVEHYRGLKIPQTEEYARYNKWVAVIAERPSIKLTLAPMEKILALFERYTKPVQH